MKNHLPSLAMIIAIVICVSLPNTCFAQQQGEPNPATTKTFERNGLELAVQAPTSVEPGSKISLLVNLTVPDGYHIYGSRDKTYPTKFNVSETPNFALGTAKVPSGVRHSKPGGGVNYWLERRHTIKQSLAISEDAKGVIEVNGFLDFMICDDKACKPPGKLEFNISLNIKADKEATESSNVQPDFEAPVRLKVENEPIIVEEPGFAAPYVADLDGDGQADLLVGQFNDGKIMIYKGLGKGNFDSGHWLKANGKVASVPGVW